MQNLNSLLSASDKISPLGQKIEQNGEKEILRIKNELDMWLRKTKQELAKKMSSKEFAVLAKFVDSLDACHEVLDSKLEEIQLISK